MGPPALAQVLPAYMAAKASCLSDRIPSGPPAGLSPRYAASPSPALASGRRGWHSLAGSPHSLCAFAGWLPAPGYAGSRARLAASGLSDPSDTDPTEVLTPMTVRLHRGDLPDLSRYTSSVAIDTETMGLNPHRDRLCVV